MADEGLRFEAWSMPHVGALTKKFDFSKWVESYTLNDRFNDLCDGVMGMPDDFPLKAQLFNIDEANHANDVGSMVKVLRGTTPILHYLVTRSEDSWSDTEPTHKLNLEGPEWILDRCLVPNYDHPADPTVEPDWIYGADSILANTDLETAGVTSAKVQLSVNASAGTYKIGVDYPVGTGFVYTANIAWNGGASGVQTAIETLMAGWDVSVNGEGSDANPFIIELLTPLNVQVGWATDSALLTGLASILNVSLGGATLTDPWTRALNPTTGIHHGGYYDFEVSTTQAHTGTSSLYINGTLGEWPDSFPGAQQVVSATGGRTYRCGIWVYPKFAARYRFVLRTSDETWIGQVEADLTANSWQQLTFSATVPSHVRSVIFRISCISNVANVGEFYIDDALFAPGQDAATLGKMMDDIRTAAIAVGSPLSWLTPTWSTTLDSDGAAWDSARQWNVNHGQSFYQLIEYKRRWNYESRLRWDVADNRFEWDMWNPSAGGQVRAGIAITGKSGVMGSSAIVKKPPNATYIKTEGSAIQGGLPWGEFASTTLDDVWGRLEKFHQDRQGVNSTELDTLAERMVATAGDHSAARTITISDPSILPWTAYEPGDTLTLNLAPKDVKRELRVASIVVKKDPGDAAPKYDVHFGSPTYANDTSLAAGLRKLIRDFQRPTPTGALFDGRPVGGGIATGGTITTFSLPGQAFLESGRLRQYFSARTAIVGVRAAVHVAPTGAAVIVDVHKNGTTIFADQGQRPTIAVSTNVSAESVPTVNIVEPGEYITVDIDQAGSTIPGGDVTVMVRWKEVTAI